eukprot:TRINITY_DN4151_c1_g2_i3.p1 TRINITY_DN4151_c1_g2~~TRINITY_DN4151_c1_g2_i3.p1  ORF type:complete len:465 (+),score=38.27 TRINITY_DN4151_c1_g2_i3:439-1833(+)
MSQPTRVPLLLPPINARTMMEAPIRNAYSIEFFVTVYPGLLSVCLLHTHTRMHTHTPPSPASHASSLLLTLPSPKFSPCISTRRYLPTWHLVSPVLVSYMYPLTSAFMVQWSYKIPRHFMSNLILRTLPGKGMFVNHPITRLFQACPSFLSLSLLFGPFHSPSSATSTHICPSTLPHFCIHSRSIKPEYNLATCEHDPESATTYVTWFGVTDTQPPMYAVRFGTMNTTSGQVTHLKDFPQLYQNYTSLGKSAYDIKNKIYYTLLGSDVFGRSIAAINVKTLDVSVSPVCPQCAIQDLKVSQSDQSLIVTRMSPEKYNNVTGNFTYDIVSWSIQGGLGKRVGYLYETFPSNGTGFYNGFHNTGYDWVNKKYYANLGPYLLEASINPGSPNGPAKPFPITAGVNNMRYVSMTDFTTDPDDNAIIVHRLRGGLRERRGEWAADQRGAGRIRVKTDGPVTTIEAVVPK